MRVFQGPDVGAVTLQEDAIRLSALRVSEGLEVTHTNPGLPHNALYSASEHMWDLTLRLCIVWDLTLIRYYCECVGPNAS